MRGLGHGGNPCWEWRQWCFAQQPQTPHWQLTDCRRFSCGFKFAGNACTPEPPESSADGPWPEELLLSTGHPGGGGCRKVSWAARLHQVDINAVQCCVPCACVPYRVPVLRHLRVSVCTECRLPLCHVPCAMCHVPCAVCRVPCAVCRVALVTPGHHVSVCQGYATAIG
jgi:hypothetical protein